MSEPLVLTCADVDDLAALFVLDALGAGEATAVAAHLADHPERHPSFRELAGVTPFLAESVAPAAPPPDLRARVLGSVAATPQVVPGSTAASPSAVVPPSAAVPRSTAVPGSTAVSAPSAVPAPEAVSPTASRAPAPTSIDAARRRRASRGWTILAAAAVLAIVALGAWAFSLQQQQSDARNRLALVSQAVAAAAQPGARVAQLAGSETAGGATGLAVFPVEGPGWIVVTDLPDAGSGHTWQAWTLADGQPASAGLLTPDADGLAVLPGVAPVAGTSVVALTVEPAGGSQAPTTQPVVVGQLDTPLAMLGGLIARP